MRVSHYFTTNPAARAPQGRRLEPWSTELPKSWRSALGVAEAGPEERAQAQDAEEEPEARSLRP